MLILLLSSFMLALRFIARVLSLEEICYFKLEAISFFRRSTMSVKRGLPYIEFNWRYFDWAIFILKFCFSNAIVDLLSLFSRSSYFLEWRAAVLRCHNRRI